MRTNFEKPPNMYDFEDLVAYVLQAAEQVDVYEPSTQREEVTCT